jgi:hypothetical protein
MLLPSRDRRGAIFRTEFDRVAAATGHFGRDDGGPAADERVINRIALQRVIEDRPAHALDRLLRAVAGVGAAVRDLPEGDLLAIALPVCGLEPARSSRASTVSRFARAATATGFATSPARPMSRTPSGTWTRARAAPARLARRSRRSAAGSPTPIPRRRSAISGGAARRVTRSPTRGAPGARQKTTAEQGKNRLSESRQNRI